MFGTNGNNSNGIINRVARKSITTINEAIDYNARRAIDAKLAECKALIIERDRKIAEINRINTQLAGATFESDTPTHTVSDNELTDINSNLAIVFG
jgi:hypothetical protein